MHINTTARHCELDPEDRLFAQERLGKLQRYARDLHEAHLVVTAEGYRHSAEITLRLKHRDLVSREESTEMRQAIDLAADRLEQQLRRIKEKRIDKKRVRPREGREGTPDGAAAGDSEGEDLGEE